MNDETDLIERAIQTLATAGQLSGELYRILDPDERVIEGDEWQRDDGLWVKSRNWKSSHGKQNGRTPYRRRIIGPTGGTNGE